MPRRHELLRRLVVDFLLRRERFQLHRRRVNDEAGRRTIGHKIVAWLPKMHGVVEYFLVASVAVVPRVVRLRGGEGLLLGVCFRVSLFGKVVDHCRVLVYAVAKTALIVRITGFGLQS